MREFRDQIFHGNSSPHWQKLCSDGQCYRLLKRVEEGFTCQSMLQQGATDRRLQYDLEAVVRDVVAALLGREIILGDILPSQPKKD